MQDLWWIFAIFASFIFAMYIFANQVFKLKGSLVMIYRGIGAGLVLLPFVFFAPLIKDPNFYYVCVLQGFLIAYLDNRLFNAAKKFGAELTSIIQPISVVFVFIAWFFVSPEQFHNFVATPLRLVLTSFAIFFITYSVIMLKKNKINKKAFLYLLPALISVTILDILCKKLMIWGSENVVSAIFYYALITSLIAGFINLVIYLKKKNPIEEIFKPQNLLFAGVPVIALIFLMYIFKNYSLYLASNPAYVMAIIYSYPIWILLANNLFYRYDKQEVYSKPSKRVITMVVVSIITLILVAQ